MNASLHVHVLMNKLKENRCFSAKLTKLLKAYTSKQNAELLKYELN